MTLNFTPTSFTSGTTMSSSTVNSNFTAMQPQSVTFSGTWVARNNTSIGLTATDYTYSPLSVNVVRLAPPLTSPDRGIVLAAMKSAGASDRLGLDAATGKWIAGALRNANAEQYVFYDIFTGIGPGTFTIPNFLNQDFTVGVDGFMLNMGTTAASGGSAAAIGHMANFPSNGNSSPIVNVYVGAGVPWICVTRGSY